MSEDLRRIPDLLPTSLEGYMAWVGVEPAVIDSLIKESYDFEMCKGDVFAQGYNEAAICFVKSGMLHGLREFHGDMDFCLGYFLPGHIMASEDTLAYAIKNEPVTIFEAMSDCSLTILSGSVVSKYVKVSEKFFRFSLDCFTRRHLTLRDWRSVKDKVGKKQFLIFTLTGFFDVLSHSGQRDVHISIKQLSELTGTSRQYVTDVLSQLIEEGCIEKKYRNFAPKSLSKLKKHIQNKELYSSLWGQSIS